MFRFQNKIMFLCERIKEICYVLLIISFLVLFYMISPLNYYNIKDIIDFKEEIKDIMANHNIMKSVSKTNEIESIVSNMESEKEKTNVRILSIKQIKEAAVESLKTCSCSSKHRSSWFDQVLSTL